MKSFLIFSSSRNKYFVLSYDQLIEKDFAYFPGKKISLEVQIRSTSPPEFVDLILVGSFVECEKKKTELDKEMSLSIIDFKPGKASNVKTKKEVLASEFLTKETLANLKKEYESLKKDYDELKESFQQQTKILQEKNEVIEDLTIKINDQKEGKEGEEEKEGKEKEENDHLKELKKIITEGFHSIHEMVSFFNFFSSSFKNLFSYSIYFLQFGTKPIRHVSSDYVLLKPGMKIAANKSVYCRAQDSTASSFVQRIITGVFDYQEIMGATLNGKTGRKRKLGNDSDEPKCLDQEKVDAILGKFDLFQLFI